MISCLIYWKPVILSLIFGFVCTIDSKPLDNNVGLSISSAADRSNSEQLINNYDDTAEEKSRESLSRFFYNVSDSDYEVPVQVIYDPPASDYHSDQGRQQKNSKNYNLDVNAIKQNIKKYYMKKEDVFEQKPNNPIFIINGDHKNDTKIPPVILKILGGITESNSAELGQESNDEGEKDIKYILPILNKLNEYNNNRYYQLSQRMNPIAPASIAQPPLYPSQGNLNPSYMTAYPYYPPNPFMPFDYPYYNRQWQSPFNNYFPIVIRDPFQSFFEYFGNLIESGPTADVCRKAHHQSSYFRRKRSTESVSDLLRKNQHRRLFNITKKKDTLSEPIQQRGTDVGPQISKLVVRRGGVAIAGAGGIATAGSGGTAIVGPGGTAFTTPASSGGVAMVGPGGKVINIPDSTNSLHGRNVVATGAGHTTFTNKDGEVYTTSDNTGGLALVGPSGLTGIADNDIAGFDKLKELKLPAGARLLTTGPVIYYNPVYPMNK